MRAREFAVEKINPETASAGFHDQQAVNDGKWLIRAEGQEQQYGTHTANVLHVQVVTNDNQRRELAWAKFLVKQRPEDGEQYLESVYTFVAPEHRGQGLAKIMYQYANGLGNDIRPSGLQTDLGRGMWQGLNKTIKQPPALPAKEQPKPSIWKKFTQALTEINAEDELSVSQRIQDYFTNKGYRYLGEGRDQIAFLSPRGTVVKVLGIGDPDREQVVLDYVNYFVANQQNPYYPRIYNTGNFTIDGETYFVYEMEYLQYVANEEQTLDYLEKLMSAVERDQTEEFMSKNPLPSELSDDEIYGLIQTTERLIQAIGGYAPLDLHNVENLRRRKNGHLVITDPFSL